MNKNTNINLDELPVWDFTVEIQGLKLPMISPLEANDISEGPIPAQGEIDARLARRAGVFVRLWRWLFGEPRLERADIPTDGGAAHTREVCVAILGHGNRELVREMRTAQCAQLVATYMQCQEQWLIACARQAAAVASERYRDEKPLATSHQPSGGSHQEGSRPGMQKIIPGTFPFNNCKHPNLTGGLAGDIANRAGGAQG